MPGACTNIFDDATVMRLQGGAASAPECEWTDDSSVTIRLRFLTSLYPGDRLELRGDTVYPREINGDYLDSCTYIRDGYDKCAKGGVSVLQPAHPLRPTARLSAPRALSVCDDLSLNGILSSGSGVHPLRHFWSLDAYAGAAASTNNFDAELRATLSAATGGFASSVVVPAAQLAQDTNFTFSLIVRNEMGGISPPAQAS